MHEKQKFNVLDIVESQSKEMWLVSYVTCVDIITGLFNPIINIFIFKVPTLKLKIIIFILPTNQPIYAPAAHRIKN